MLKNTNKTLNGEFFSEYMLVQEMEKLEYNLDVLKSYTKSEWFKDEDVYKKDSQ